MRRTFNNLISVLHSVIRFLILKIFNYGYVKIGGIERFSPNVVVEVNRGGKFYLGNMVRVHSGCKIKVRSDADFYIGDNVKVNYNCIFICRKKIQIGEGTEFGPSVYVYDHDHDFRAGLKNNKFNEAPVVIGKNCWIGANTVILRGSELGDGCVVAAGSVISGKYEPNSVIIQKRTDKVIAYVEEEY